MSAAKPLFSRRALVTALIGGGAVAAVAATGPSRVRRALGSFAQSFRSPFFSLERADHNAWQTQIGSLLQVSGGPSLQIVGVELFAPYGNGARRTSRRRAFAVNLQAQGAAAVADDVAHTVSHPRYGSFQLFLTTNSARPDLAVAIFN